MMMPERKFSAANSYRYGFNGKEQDPETKGIGAQYDYGFRIYDPRISRFLSVDPITNAYPWYTPYQFAGNKPIEFIDLDGLEEAKPKTGLSFFPLLVPRKANTPGTLMQRELIRQKQKFDNSRIGRFTNGLVNTGFGVVGTIASVKYMVGTGGVGASLGGSAALMFSLGEIGVGVTQMIDAIAGKQDGSSDFLHNSSTLPGMIAYGANFKYASYIDAFSALGPSLTTSGGIKTFLKKDIVGLKSAFSAFVESPSMLNSLGLIDQVLDVKGFAVESVELFNSFGSNGNLKAQTLKYQLSYSVQKGDVLTSIAKRLNTTVEALVKQNNISDPNKIVEGQKLSYTNEITEKVKTP